MLEGFLGGLIDLPWALLLVIAAALLAGFVDAIVGGGGLILTPAVFSAYPLEAAATVMGTNKSASTWGSAMAAWSYARRVALVQGVVLWGCAACLLGSLAGAGVLLLVPSDAFRMVLPVVLVALLIYTLVNKNLGQTHAPRFAGVQQTQVAVLIGFAIGFYDGFFGPGTGSFFVFLFVRVLGFDFLAASAHAKLFNFCTNLAALILLAFKGHVLWQLTPFLLVANVLGSFYGSKVAMQRGTGFVRWVFIVVVGGLIAKTAWDAIKLL